MDLSDFHAVRFTTIRPALRPAMRPSLSEPFSHVSGSTPAPTPGGALEVDGFPILVDGFEIIFA